jgi:hypothetical protein
MHNLALTVILAEQGRRQCPCGAVADRSSGLCCKCKARNSWRRKTTSVRRKTAHRVGHHARKVARLIADALAGMED